MASQAQIARAAEQREGSVTEADFRRIVERQRGDLHAHCYRMLGSLHDADDAIQDALVRAWRALPRFRGDSALETWLYRIATNVCLDAIAKRPKRPVPVGGEQDVPAPVTPPWIEPYPDDSIAGGQGPVGPEARYERREALELAFIAALQNLPPRQRAVLVLRDVLGFSAKETAAALDTTVASANGALQRARRSLENRLPEESQQAAGRALGDRRLRELVDRFADAFERGDVPAILSLLTEDVTFAMPPYEGWTRGREAIAGSWLMPAGPPPRLRYVPARANGQAALGVYVIEPSADAYMPLGLDVLAFRGDRVVDVTVFRMPELFARFGLPAQLRLDR